MKKILLFIASSFLFAESLLFTQTTFANFSYPLDQIAKPSCRKEAWNTLQDTCKITLPKMIGAKYELYKDATEYRRIYTVLWGATYDYGWDVGYGSHLGVDIATSGGTPVLAIGDGTVEKSGWGNGWGNYITIKHTLTDGTTIYSNYAHLSELAVKSGEKVTRGVRIGAVGNTGNSYGNHLHFQIDITNQLHPYYYVTCGAGKDPMSLVNKGECRSYLTANTIDPIAFLENSTISTTNPVSQPPSSSTIEAIKEAPQTTIDRTTIKSREEILNEEAAEYLKFNRILINIDGNGMITEAGKTVSFTISSQDLSKKLVNNSLPGPGVRIVYDTKLATVFPENINLLENGKRTIQFTPKTTGNITVKFMYGKVEVGTRTFYVQPKGKGITASKVSLNPPLKVFLGQEYNVIFRPLSEQGVRMNQGNYNGTFRVDVMKGKAKFCLTPGGKGSVCDPNMVVESITFGAKDTPNGYFLTRIVSLTNTPIELQVTRLSDGVIIGKKRILVAAPLGIDRRYIYYDAVFAGISKNWWYTRSGFVGQEQNISRTQAKELIEKVLAYRILKAGNNSTRKNELRKIAEFFKKNEIGAGNTISRGEFANLLLLSQGIVPSSSPAVWNDENGKYKDAMATLRTGYNFAWLDQFGQNYFQPDKEITLGEALYLVEKVVRE